MKPSRRTIAISSLATVAVAAAAVATGLALGASGTPTAVHTPSTTQTSAPRAAAAAAAYSAPSAAAIDALPEASYSAVIAGLVAFSADSVPGAATAAYTLASDAPLYGADHQTPVARLAAKNFLGDPTVVVPVQTDGDWSLVLTPSRSSLPSKDANAPAQTAGWIRTDLLTKAQDLRLHIIVSVQKQTVSIVDASGAVVSSFGAGVGAAGTPTPTGVVGYLEARYLDPNQGQTVHPIELTSLHSAAADNPYGGEDGGLIGIHYEAKHSGAVSHGCVRLAADGIVAIGALPLGTLVLVEA